MFPLFGAEVKGEMWRTVADCVEAGMELHIPLTKIRILSILMKGALHNSFIFAIFRETFQQSGKQLNVSSSPAGNTSTRVE